MSLAALTGVPASAGPSVPDVLQATRDSERMAILRQEHQNTQASIEALSRRRAARLQAADVEGVAQVDIERARALGDLLALERELQSASSEGPSALGQRGTHGPRSSEAKVSVRRPEATAPPRWWDVYQPRSDGTSASVPPRTQTHSPVRSASRDEGSGS